MFSSRLLLTILFYQVVSSCLIALTSCQEPANDKTYNFRYSTGNEGPAQMWREERREADGTVVGRYGYIDPNGEERIVEYRANPDSGFQASGDTGPDKAALRYSQQQAADHQREVTRAMNDWNRAASRSPVSARTASQPASPWSTKQESWNAPAAPRTSWNSAPSWQSNAGNNMQWNNAWSNFNWNENNARVMADWNAPQRRSSWEQPSSPIQAPPLPSWSNWNNNNNQEFTRRSSPATAFRQQQRAPAIQETSWNDQPTTESFARRRGQSSVQASQQRAPATQEPTWNDQPTTESSQRSGHSAVQVSQDPFSFSFGIDHSSK